MAHHEQQDHTASLTRGMEHMRPYVTVAPRSKPSSTPSPPHPPSAPPLDSYPKSQTQPHPNPNDDPPPTVYGIPSTLINPPRRPPTHRSHTPSNNQKRTDPFSFGSRYLEEGDDIFEFNAWDHVETDDAFKEFAEEQYKRQRESPVSDFDRNRINTNPAKPWNRFYSNNSANFFKNRKWLFQEFPTLAEAVAPPPLKATLDQQSEPLSCASNNSEDDDKNKRGRKVTIMEIGAGAGNTAFPLLTANQNPGLKIHALDFSSAAVNVMRKDPAYDERFIRADVWDLAASGASAEEVSSASPGQTPTAQEEERDASGSSTASSNQHHKASRPQPQKLTPSLPPQITPSSIDIVLLIFTLSALSPLQWPQALLNIHTALKPGGEVLFRDYGAGDLAQVRFKKGRWMGERFYVRGDGTRVYFFGEEELRELWEGGGVLGSDDKREAKAEGEQGEEEENEEERKTNGANSNPAATATATTSSSSSTIPSTPPMPLEVDEIPTNPNPNPNPERSTNTTSDPRHSPSSNQSHPKFEVLNLATDRRMLVNRCRKLKMYRCWMQGRFRKSFFERE